MFIAIFIAVLLAGLYFFMKPKKSPEEVAKAKVENLVKSMMGMVKTMASPGFDPSSAPGLSLEFTQTALNEMMTSVHQEFGISIVPPMGLMDQLERGEDIDIDSVAFKWVSCPKNFSMIDCWKSHMNP